MLGTALESLSYGRPLHLVRGDGAWMEAADGRRYLDAYNNVPVVGHAHPRVVAAIARQAATLNTNTRYLHEHVVELAERLVATMPDGLDTVLFVNSGSEANDLAWRLATMYTGADAGLATGWSYHGVTAAVADVTASEWPHGEQPARRGGLRGARHVPGPICRCGRSRRRRRAEIVRPWSAWRERGRRPAALFVDSTFTADGIFVPEPAIVAAIVAAARDAGALFVADEVQSGHGRTGELWGFTRWGVTPDIVTLGQADGQRPSRSRRSSPAPRSSTASARGRPSSRPSAATRWRARRRWPCSTSSRRRGWWRARRPSAIGCAPLSRAGSRHEAIGDVRGRGLMTGVELVHDRASREPAGDLATRVKDEMAERGVLIGTTGRHGNTLKIRPPLCLSR